MATPAAPGSASAGAVRAVRPRLAFWWRSAVGGLLLFSLLGLFLNANARYYREITAGVLTAGALWCLVGLIRRVRRATLILAPRGLALGTGKAQSRDVVGALAGGIWLAVIRHPKAWASFVVAKGTRLPRGK